MISRLFEKGNVSFIGLSSETKPMDVDDGATYLEVDTSSLYIFYQGTWYKQ